MLLKTYRKSACSRILIETGIPLASRAARTISQTSSGCEISAEPKPLCMAQRYAAKEKNKRVR
jgi:hypothetical protein